MNFAESYSLEHISLNKTQDHIYLLSTDTEDGRFCASSKIALLWCSSPGFILCQAVSGLVPTVQIITLCNFSSPLSFLRTKRHITHIKVNYIEYSTRKLNYLHFNVYTLFFVYTNCWVSFCRSCLRQGGNRESGGLSL